MAKMGRPRKEIDFDQLDKLCGIQCSLIEIAHWFNVTIDIIERRVKERTGITFTEYYEQKRVNGIISLRRMMFKQAETNPAMAIFMAKNWLGMADTQRYEHTGANGGPIRVDKASELSDSDLAIIAAEGIIHRQSTRGRPRATPKA